MLNEETNNEKDIAHIPLRNLPYSGLIAHYYDEWEEGDPTRPNNVLISQIDNLDKVSVVGRDKETGAMIYCSSSNNPREVMKDLRGFIEFLKEIEEDY
jgi:hypothetical protein